MVRGDEDEEDAWRAVINNFPSDTILRPQAMIQLAFLLLGEGRHAEAGELFSELERLGEDDNELKAHALAGKAVLASLNQQYEDSDQIILVYLYPLLQKLKSEQRLNQEATRLVREAYQENSTKRKKRIDPVLLELLNRMTPSELLEEMQ